MSRTKALKNVKLTSFGGLMAVLGWCVFPFIIPDLIKIALAYVLSGKVRKYAR